MVSVPVAFTFGLGAWAVVLIGRTAGALGMSTTSNTWLFPSLTALALVVSCLLASGCRELAERLAGAARTGALAARWSFLVRVLLSVSTPLLVHFAGATTAKLFAVQGYLYCLTGLVISVGLARAAGVARSLYIPIIVLSLLAMMPPFLQESLAAFRSTNPALYVVSNVPVLAWVVVAWLLARHAAASAAPAEDSPHEASLGLLSLGGALSLRLAVAGLALVITLLALLARSGGLIKVISVGAPAFNTLSVFLFGVACLRVSRADRGEQLAFLLAGAASIWVFAISVSHTVWLYAATTESFDGGLWARQSEALMIPLAVVGILSIVMALGAAGTRARRYGAIDQSRRATFASYQYIALTLGVLAMTTWGLPRVQSMSGFLLLTIVIAALGVMSLLGPIKAFNAVGVETESAPLPVATAVDNQA